MAVGVAPLSLLPQLNAAEFGPGEPLQAALTYASPGAARAVDLCFGAFLPPAAGPLIGCPLGDGLVLVEEGSGRMVARCLSDGWAGQAPWALTAAGAHGGTYAWTDSPGGPYANDVNASLWSPAIDLSSLSTARLTFWHRYDLAGGDSANVWIRTASSQDFTRLGSFRGNGQGWRQAAVDLSAFAGQAGARVVFQL